MSIASEQAGSAPRVLAAGELDAVAGHGVMGAILGASAGGMYLHDAWGGSKFWTGVGAVLGGVAGFFALPV